MRNYQEWAKQYDGSIYEFKPDWESKFETEQEKEDFCKLFESVFHPDYLVKKRRLFKRK